MNYRAIRSFRILKGTIIIPPKLQDKRNVCMMLLSENQDFLSTHPYLPFRYVTLRHVYVPTIQKPARTYMTPEYKKELLARKLRAYRGDMKDFMSVKDKNFYLDFSLYLNMIKTRYRATKFLTGRPLMLLKTIFNNMAEVPSSEYEKVLFYSINLDEPMDERIRYRKIWPVFLMLQAFDKGTIKELPFDRLMLHVFDKNGLNNTVQLYSNTTDTRINLGRIRALLMKLKVNDESFENDVVDDTAEEAADNVIDHISTNTDNLNTERNKMSIASSIARKIPGEVKLDDINTKESLPNYAESQRSKIKNAISSYISNATKKSEISLSIEPMNMNSKKKMALKSLAYHSMADEDAADEFEDEFDEMPVQKQAVKINEFVKNTLPKVRAKNTSTNAFIKYAKPDELNDFQNPGHIYEKRKSDFRETLIEDLLDTFKVLENKHSSLKINSIDVKTIYSPPSELEPTIRDRFSLKLVDKKGRIHLATIELPHLTDNGTFMVNGQEKIITNQIITYPIFFFKPYHGKFTSSYSAVTVHSKILSKSSYLMCYMAGYKFPLILWLAYKQGFENVLKQYGVEYSISEEKETEDFIVLPNKLVLNIKNSTEQGRQLIEGIKYSAAFMSKTDKDINQPKYWKDALEDFIGNRNCIYLMDQIWLNIVTPIEVKLLEAKNDPTNINDIVHYISTQVVNGRVDDRNSLNKQRVRTSEIFVALVQKQVHAAYNEYEAKVQSGDEEARLYIDPTKTFSDVINSQNVQTLENINPVEELSTMTRITPVGIGGVTDRMAFPPKAMGIHESYYGNVDPLETPDGAGVGIQQQLTIGANITNIRGMFNVKDKNDINPSEILSAGTSMIPFVESNDGCRVLMSASQMKQAIPLKNNEIPAIQTGFESVFTNFLSDNFIKKSPVDGTVVKVEDLLITIKDKVSGKLFYIETKPRLLRSGQGKNGLSVFTSIVKEGQKVSKGDIVSEGSNVKEGTISNGLNVLCAFMPWKGYNFEDGMVISESLAKRFVSVHLQEENVYLSDEEDVVFIANVGEEYKKGNIVFSYTNAVYDVESYKHLRTDGGKIVNIEVFSNIEEDRIPEKLLPAYNETVKMMNATTGKYTLGTFREKGEKFEGILIRFTIEQMLGLNIGDKLNNRSFNKGLISIIEKDENMPYVPELGRHVEMVYNPLSVINRMNPGQLLEMNTSLISNRLAELMETNSRENFTKIFAGIMDVLDATENKQYSKNLMSSIVKMTDSEYEKLRADTKNRKFIPLVFPPFKSPDRKDILRALKMLGLKARYKVRLKQFDDWETDPVAIGFIYVMKLEHIAEKKLHARGIGPYVARTMAATQGKRKNGGQSCSEYDVVSLLAWDCPTIIDELLGPMAGDHITKNQMIAEITQSGATHYMAPKSNPVKDLFSNMMIAVHLKAE